VSPENAAFCQNSGRSLLCDVQFNAQVFFGWDVFVRPVAGRPFTTYRQYLSERDVGNLEIPQHLPNAGQYRLSCFIVFSIY